MAPGALDPLVKEMVYLAVSTANGCACDPNNPMLVCDFIYDVCCDKGQGIACHATNSGCL